MSHQPSPLSTSELGRKQTEMDKLARMNSKDTERMKENDQKNFAILIQIDLKEEKLKISNKSPAFFCSLHSKFSMAQKGRQEEQ